jgi:short-subunit dehydrogenase
MKLDQKIVLITGASSGIGARMAQMIAQRGAIPILTARSLRKLQEISAHISTAHECIELDVTREDQVRDVVGQVMAKYGTIDILINNAGYGIFDNFTDAPLHDFKEMMDVNYMGTVRCTQAVLPYMLSVRSGHIVNIASLAGKVGSAKSTAYTASKHAVIGMTNSLRLELMGTGVQLTAVNPGPIRTPFFDRADPSGNYVKNVQFLMLKPDKVVNAILRAIEKNQAEIHLPRVAVIGVWIAQLFPRLFNQLAHTFLNKK